MRVITARNVNGAYQLASQALDAEGIWTHNRNEATLGMTLEFPTPVTTVYTRPTERVLFYGRRDCNPFFHLMEGLWMLAGRRDVEWISRFNSNMKTFSDNGTTFHGAYGHRWRNHFGQWGIGENPYMWGAIDQLDGVVDILKKDPDSRRAVLQMWDPRADLRGQENKKDVPCNTAIYFKIRRGALDMTVTNRSNDMVWGCYGANAVHMSMLQEYMAGRIGVPVGVYYQISDNLHAYKAVWDDKKVVETGYTACWYETGAVKPYPMVATPDAWDEDLYCFMEGAEVGSMVNPFFRDVARPVEQAWFLYKNKKQDEAKEMLTNCVASDWRVACLEWIERHPGKKEA